MKEQTRKVIKDLEWTNFIFMKILYRYLLSYESPCVKSKLRNKLNHEKLIIENLIGKIDYFCRILCNYLEVLKLRKQEVEKELSDNP